MGEWKLGGTGKKYDTWKICFDFCSCNDSDAAFHHRRGQSGSQTQSKRPMNASAQRPRVGHLRCLPRSQTTVSFGAQNSSLGRGGNRGSEAPRDFLPAQGWHKWQSRGQGSGLPPGSLQLRLPCRGRSWSLFPPIPAGAGADTQGRGKLGEDRT